MFVNNNKSNFVFLPNCVCIFFWSCMTFFNKFVENMNEFGCFWKEFEEFLEMDDEFEHVEFIQQYEMFEMEMGENFLLHRGRFKTGQPKEDDIARCMCMTDYFRCLFSCVEKDPRVVQ